MDDSFKHLKKNKIIYIIMLLFILVKLLTISKYNIVWWDSSVYIGMGKYIYSFGNAGLWESSRPIFWPLMLGFLWKIGFNVILVGRIIEIIFGSLCILMVYLIGEKLFDKKTALLSSIFLALSSTFFFFNGIMLTEIVSTLFSLVAILFFIEKKYFISGVFLGIAFMTRFLQLFVFVAAVLTILINYKKNIKNFKKILIGFIITITPFLILNQISYNNTLLPFLQQIFLSNNSGWLNYHPLSYYFIELFKENFLYLLFIFGILLVLKSKDKNKTLIVTIFLLLFIFFNSIKQKEMRFLIILFPYMYLLISYTTIHFLNKSKNNTFKNMILMIVILSFIFSILNMAIYYKNELNKNNKYKILQNKFEDYSINGKIWVSNPVIAVSSNKKIDKLMYYPVFNEEKKEELIENAKNADFIFIDSCDLGCKPSDLKCESNKNELLAYFKQHLNVAYSSKINKCGQFVFKK